MYGYVTVAVLMLLVSLASPQVQDSTCDSGRGSEIVLDTYLFGLLLPRWTLLDIDDDGNTWELRSNETCRQTVGTCSSNNVSQQNFLISSFVDGRNLLTQNISILVEFSEGSCLISPDECTTNFGLLIYSTSAASNESLNISNYDEVITSVVQNNTRIPYSLPEDGDGFYLAFQDTSTCVVINRIRVLYAICSATTNGFARYNETVCGQSTVGTCVENAIVQIGASLNANCMLEGTFNYMSPEPCHCNSGHQSNSSNVCVGCPEGTFKQQAGNQVCTPCPSNSNTTVMGSTQCQCDIGYERDDPSDATTACSRCETDFYYLGGRCYECPVGSTSSGQMVTECTCDPVLATSNGSVTTTDDGCVNCRADHYRNGPDCIPCPLRSSRMFQADQSMCVCNSNGVTENGSTTTSGQNCTGCAAGYYTVNGDCQICPANSDRTASADDSECLCVDNYVRLDPSNPQHDCIPIIGFLSDTVTLLEGMQIIAIHISATTMMEPSTVSVALNYSPSREGMDTIDVSTASLQTMFQIMSGDDDDIALEDDTTFNISVTSVSPQILVIGGSTSSVMLRQSIAVTVQDDDMVEVGFTKSSVQVDQSTSIEMLTVMADRGIASDLELRLVGGGALVSDSSVVLLSGDSPPTTEVRIDVSDLTDGDVVELRLEFVGPQQHARSVVVGGTDTEEKIRISLESAAFPLEAIIGISAGGAGLAVLLLIIVIMCLCICRLRVNRQGFYHTYEDKVSEPPTMLRYSASLRSISSQTVIPVSEGKTVSKENEFYV